MLLEVQWENCYTTWIYNFVCVHLFGCQKKSTCFQKFKYSNVFYARARKMMPVAPQELATKRLVYVYI